MQLSCVKKILIRRGKDPIYMTKSKESLTKPLHNLNIEKKPNFSSGSAKEVIDNISFKSAKDKLDSRAEEQL